MSESEFQDYWLNYHGPNFAIKIPQIAKYKIDLRLPCSIDPNPIWSGCAEIWLRNDAEQLASMQTPEFLQGARLDEPNWAAFWMTAVLDCDTRTVIQGSPAADGGVKLMVIAKRDLSHDLSTYRRERLAMLQDRAETIPGILRVDLAFARDGLYAVGESRFDEVAHFWFASVDAAEAAFADPTAELMLPRIQAGPLQKGQAFPMLTSEHWLIGPEARAI
jgi:hypothetical protein